MNITIGMALVSFLIFHVEGFRHLGVRGYLGKFFPVYEFRNGIGAGVIAMFVGLIELMLEFVKPVTLSMRLFGNIYGGEVALGVITALTIAIIPGRAASGWSCMLNAIQALIFSVLTLMFIVAGHREPSRRGGPRRRGGARGQLEGSTPNEAPARPLTRRARRTNHGPNDPGPLARGVGGSLDMEHIGAGLAALGVFGPGIGIGILAGLSATAIGRNPDAAGQIRGIAIILAAFAEGPRRPGDRRRPARDLHQVAGPARRTASWTCWPSRPASGARSSA